MLKKPILLCTLGLTLAQCSTMQEEPRLEVTPASQEQAPSNPYERMPQMALEVVNSMLLDDEFRSIGGGRSVDKLIDLADMPSLRSTSPTDEFLDHFLRCAVQGQSRLCHCPERPAYVPYLCRPRCREYRRSYFLRDRDGGTKRKDASRLQVRS